MIKIALAERRDSARQLPLIGPRESEGMSEHALKSVSFKAEKIGKKHMFLLNTKQTRKQSTHKQTYEKQENREKEI